MEELEQKALDFLKEREFEKSAQLYLQLAVAHPENENYLIAAANCYDALGDKKLAFGLYKKALAINPVALTALLNLSALYYEAKKYDKAEELACQALEANPDNFSALMTLGNVAYARADFKTALMYYEQVYKLNPNSYNALVNIANTSYNLSEFLKAIEYATQAIEKRPRSVEAYIIAGNAYIELDDKDKATEMLKQAALLAPTSAWLSTSVANLFHKMGNWKQCLHYFWKSFALKGFKVSADDHINLGYVLYEAFDENKGDVAEKYLARWEEMFPDNPIVKHCSSSIRNIQDIPAMDLSYVKSLFDGFASTFDDILQQLDYQVPALIAAQLKGVFKTNLFKKRRILDLGCGTGLCTEALKKNFPSEEYFGVDISDKMLETAGRKAIYKELYADDIFNFLTTTETQYHLAVAGDVLTYMGDLKPFFRAVARAVKINGLIAFSISKNKFNQEDYFLARSGRFVHSVAYVRRLLKFCGFEVVSQKESVLRREGKHPVEGVVLVARKDIEVIFA